MRRKYLTLAAIGLLIISLGNIAFRYTSVSDFSKGITFGIGLGIMLLSLYRMRKAVQ